jgi:hypothetical protein
VGGEQLGHPPVLIWSDFDDAEFVVGDGSAEFGGQSGVTAPLRVGEQVAYLGNGKRGTTRRDQLAARNAAHRA